MKLLLLWSNSHLDYISGMNGIYALLVLKYHAFIGLLQDHENVRLPEKNIF